MIITNNENKIAYKNMWKILEVISYISLSIELTGTRSFTDNLL